MRRAILATALVAALAAGPVSCGESPRAQPPAAAPTHDADIAAAAAAAEAEARRIIDAITLAERTRVYSGYKSALHGEDGRGRRTRMRVQRRADGRMVLEWDAGGTTTRRWVVRSRHRWIDDPSLLLENYDVVLPGDEVEDVAWRAVERVELRPRHPGRPSLTLLVDTETRLVLAEQLRDHDGVQRFAWRFDTIDFDPEPEAFADAEVVAAPSCIETDSPTADGAAPAQPALSLGAPPAGFTRVARQRAQDGTLTEYWSDGLAAFVFRQTPAADLTGSDEGDFETRACSGRASVSGTVEGVAVELLGNLPTSELEAVAASLCVGPEQRSRPDRPQFPESVLPDGNSRR